jgi:hypothetical protein
MAADDPGVTMQNAEAAVPRPLLLSADTRVSCPKCDSTFSLERGFARAALEQFELNTEGALEAVRKAERADAATHAQQVASQQGTALRNENAELRGLLQAQGQKHAKALKEVSSLVEQATAPQLQALRLEITARQKQIEEFTARESALAAREQGIESQIVAEARKQAQLLLSDERTQYEDRLAERQRQLEAGRTRELELLKEQQALKDRAGELEIEVARKLDVARAELESRVRAQERERSELVRAELQKQIADMNEQLAEAQRKGSQGSQQLQGEVLELTLQADLESAFPLDVIEEVRKGARGGDVIQRVMTRSGQVAGVLLWEAKRARDWSPQWTGKLKDDVRGCGADLGILVSIGTAFPKDWDEGQLFGLHEDVWLTSWTTALQLATVLRAGLVDLHKQRVVSAGKGEKMEAVYDYLTSSQFAQKLKAIHGAFFRMRQELEAEKTQTLQRWARREKQLQIGVAELVGVAGDIQGLAQQDLPLLEIDGGPELASGAGKEAEMPQLGLKMEG